MRTCLRALVCEWQDLGRHRGKERGCGWHTSASSLSVSSSTFTVRMKARCARTWRSASRRYFLQAHGGGRRGWRSVRATRHSWMPELSLPRDCFLSIPAAHLPGVCSPEACLQ